jgi:uncharacterized protein
MVADGARAMLRQRQGKPVPLRHSGSHTWIHGLPLKMRFRTSKLYISAIVPFAIGIAVGILAAILGTGGGFLMLPAMIYLLGMPTVLAVGTSLFQIVFVAAFATVLHAVENKTVDIVLAAILIGGGVIGAQFGAVAGEKLRSEHLRILLGVVVLIVASRMAFDLVTTPADLYSIGPLTGG